MEDMHTHHDHKDMGLGPITWRSYVPLAIILLLILATVVAIGLGYSDLYSLDTVHRFMIGSFLVFGGFKLLDLKGFAEGYSTYDLVAKKIYAYGYVYPFLEVSFGLAMILLPFNHIILWTTFVIMIVSGLGVIIKLRDGEDIKCVCLGTAIKLPLSTVTILENFGMAALALVLLSYGV